MKHSLIISKGENSANIEQDGENSLNSRSILDEAKDNIKLGFLDKE